jgi:hypothetical protein
MSNKLTNAAAEQLVIGSVIATPGALDAIAEKLGPGDFHEPRIGTIYSAAARLALAGTTGAPALVEELRAGGELDHVGGDRAIAFLVGRAVGNLDEIKTAAGIVRDLARKREKAAKAYAVAHAISSGSDAAAEIEELASGVWAVDAEGWTDLGGVVSAIAAGTHQRLEPTLLRRDDGAALLYPGRLNWISAPPESMKSWLAKLACVQLLEQGLPAVYVDFEEADGASCAERLVSIALGRGHAVETVRDWVEGPIADGTRDASARLFFYRAATTGLDPAARAQIVRIVRSRSVSLVVLDGVAAAMSSHVPTLEEDKARDVNLWLSGFAWPIVSLGAGVFCVDHVAKNAGGAPGSFQSRSPRGSGAKLAAVSGTALTATVREPGSAWTVGKVDVDVVKDRPGRVKVTTKQNRRHAATLVSTPAATDTIESTHLELMSPEQVDAIAAEKRWDLIAAELVSRLLSENGEPMSKTEIRDTLNERRTAKGGKGWRAATLSSAFDFLVSRGWVTVEKDGREQLLGSVRPYLAEYGEIGNDDLPF